MLRLVVLAIAAGTTSAASYTANAWYSTGPDYSYPEKGFTRGTGSAILFSGGGTRAYNCALGETRALQKMGLLKSLEYMGGVSGGNWFASAFTFDQRSYTDDERLCPYYEPSELTTDVLNTMDEACLGNGGQENIYVKAAKYIAEYSKIGWKDLNEVWTAAVQEVFLDPFDIPSKAVMTYSEDSIRDIRRRNPRLLFQEFVTPHSDDMPYVVLEGTMLAPQDLNPLVESTLQFVPIDFTPLYVGMPHTYTFDYQSKSGEKRTAELGGFVETFAYGGEPLSDFSEESVEGDTVAGSVTTRWPDRVFTVGQAAGISSMAPGAGLEQISNGTTLIINETMFSIKDPLHTVEDMLMGDGGDQDNFGLIGMIRRRVPRIMVMVNAQQELVSSDVWNPYESDPTTSDIDGYVPSLFGVQTFSARNPAFYTVNNQIFDSADFPKIAADLQAADATGYGAMAKSTLTTVANDLMGVPAGIEVEIVWYYLSMPSVWYSQLPAEVQADIDAGADGPYPEFPHYSTMSPKLIALNAAQSNLLTNMVAWTLVQYETMVSEIMA